HTRWPRDWSSDVCSSDLFRLQSAVGRTLLSRGSRIFHHGPRARRFLTPNAPFGSKASGKRLYLFGAAADLPADAGSTPKSQTKRFMPSGRISARTYSPGGSGSPSVKR